MTDLILTIIHGYDYPFLEPFFESLKLTGFNGKIVIFVSETVSRTTRAAIKRQGALLVDYNTRHPYMTDYATAFQAIVPGASISNYRFILFREFLLTHQAEYQRVAMTDVRDVIFQRNPFTGLNENEIHVFLEDPVQTFRYSELNYQWSVAANGQSVTDTFINEVVSCAGFTIGGMQPVLAYLNHMKRKLEYREVLPWAFDQGVHNGYVYALRPPEMRTFKNDEAVVATLGAYQPYQLNAQGAVVNSRGDLYAVVHQYDRSGKLFALVKRKYVGSRFLQKIKRVFYLIMP
ncbi:hypothetical protein [Mucilaginibacter sp.]|uniref:hypothetical protein n=1 Tax=Mucilaginibacter sp. TaxID=1882438 RepID=UPI0035BBD0A1